MTSLLLLKSMLFANALQKSNKKKKRKLKKTVAVKDHNHSTCRVCNEERGEIPIFNNFIHPNIPDEIEHFSGVKVSTSDNLSTHMCQNCLDLLNGCIMFREMCQRSNKKMIELSIKKEYTEYNNCEEHHKPLDDIQLDDTDESYNIPSPSFSDDNSELWGCSSCSREFFSLTSLNIHLLQCGKSGTAETTQPVEEGTKKKFLCDVCGKTAYSNANLLVHMGIHENVFPYKCEECPYQGRTMDLLKVHKRSHLIDKPYKCTQCPKATTTSSNLAKHMRHVHSTSRPYKCSYCEKAFSYQHDMKRHVKDIHLRQGTVECDVCNKKFNTKKILQGHRWKIHKIKGERQGRLPSYLLCQMDDHNEDNINDCEPNY